MARFWVGGTGNWSDTTHWAASSGGTSGQTVPDNTQAVTFDGNSGTGTVTCDVTPSSASLDFTGGGASPYGGSFDINAKTLTVGSNSLSSSFVTFTPGMTLLQTGGGTIFVVLGSGTGTITTAGLLMPSWNQGGNGGTWTLQDAFSQTGASNIFTLGSAAFNTNNKAWTIGQFSSSNSSVRTLTMGSSAVTVTASGTAWTTTTTTNLTVTSNTATITFTGVAVTVSTGFINFQGTSFVFNGSGTVSFGGSQVNNLTRTGTATPNDSIQLSNTTMTGTLTCTGNSTQNRLLVVAIGGVVTSGSQRTLTAAAVSLTDCDFMDIAGAGAAAPFTGTSLGDCGGNSGITFDTSTPQTWQGTAGGNWSDVTKWTSRIPLPQDDVSIASAFTGGQTITMDMPRLGRSVSFAGTTGSPLLAYGANSSSLFGSLNLTGIGGIPSSGSVHLILAGRGAYTLTTGGISLPGGAGRDLFITAPTGTYTLQDNISWGCALEMSEGAFDANIHNVQVFSFVGNSPITVKMGSGTWTLFGSGTIWSTGSQTSIIPGTATIVLSDTTSGAKTFVGSNFSYGTLRYASTGTGGLIITGNNQFTNVDVEAINGRTATFPAGGTQIVNMLTLRGLPGSLSVVSSSPGTQTTIVIPTGGFYNIGGATLSGDVVIVTPPLSGGGVTGLLGRSHL